MIVIVSGSRDWPNPQQVTVALVGLHLVATSLGHEEFVVRHGDCPTGTDRHAKMWVEKQRDIQGARVIEDPHPANWSQFSQSAGPMRNRRMAQMIPKADLCLAFLYEPGGRLSKGTENMIDWAEAEDIPVWSVVLNQ